MRSCSATATEDFHAMKLPADERGMPLSSDVSQFAVAMDNGDLGGSCLNGSRRGAKRVNYEDSYSLDVAVGDCHDPHRRVWQARER
jgi:hypothetical protein